MTKVHEVIAEVRTDEGKGASRRLRHAGMVPAIVYGADEAPQNIQVEHRNVLALAKHEWFFSSVLTLIVGGKKQKVLLRDWQKHPYKLQMMHMDFLRIRAGEKLRTTIPLHFTGQENSPAEKTSGVVVSHSINEIEVECLAEDLPEYIDVDLSGIDQGDSVHLSDLKLPKGVEMPELQHGPEHDLAVVTVHAIKVEVEPTTETEDADEVEAIEQNDGKSDASDADEGDSGDNQSEDK